MINIILFIAVFIIVLFFYLHLEYHNKVNNEMTIYEVNEISKGELQKAHELRSPYLFSHSAVEHISLPQIPCKVIHLENYKKTKSFLPVEVKREECNTLLQQKKYVRMHKNDESVVKEIKKANNKGLAMLKPYGFAKESITLIENNKEGTWNQKMKSERNYIVVPENPTIVRLCNSTIEEDYEMINDHHTMNYYVDTNIWSIENKQKYQELELHKGTVLHVPKGWYVSVKNSPVIMMNYDSPMSVLSRAKDYILNFMQKVNTTTISNETKKIDINNDDIKESQ